MIPALFVAGTGTDIGKTYVGCGLVRAGLRRGPFRAFKPVASGFDPASPRDSDAGRLLAALGEPATAATIAAISPWRFAAPLSPDQAAARENRTVDFDALVAFCRGAMEGGPLLVEGVGGVMVPLTAQRTTLDWMQQLGWPVLLVTGAYLGTISHTLTAMDALAHRGLHVATVVVNGHVTGHVPIEDTLYSLGRFLPGVPIVAIPDDAPEAAFDRLTDVLTAEPATRPPARIAPGGYRRRLVTD
jgi:dethiobiotin synthetase